MEAYACNGYCLPITLENMQKFNISIKDIMDGFDKDDQSEQFINELASCNNILEALEKIVDEYGTGFDVPVNLPCKKIFGVISRYDPDYGGTDDDLKEGLYIEFDEKDLYIKQETDIMNQLKGLGIEPTFCGWVSIS